MATKRVDSSNLRAVCAKYLEQFGNAAYSVIEETCAETAKEVAKELRKGGSYNTHATGEKYNKGWTTEEQTGRLKGSRVMMASTIVYNKNIPGLAHLLEFGHVKRNGGRTKAFNYIAPIADSAEQKFEKNFEKNFERVWK